MNKSIALKKDSRETIPWAAKLAKALKRVDTHSPMHVFEALQRDEMQLWELNDSIVITCVKKYPLLRACEVFAAAGDFEDVWRIMDEQVEPWAKRHGCDRIQGGGRMGWERSAKLRGYSKMNLNMVKDLKS